MTSLPRGLNSLMIEFIITQVLLTNILCSIAGPYLRKKYRVGQISSLFSPPTAAADTLNSFDLCYQLHYLTFSFIVWIWNNISHQSVPIKCLVCHENRLAYDCPWIVLCDRTTTYPIICMYNPEIDWLIDAFRHFVLGKGAEKKCGKSMVFYTLLERYSETIFTHKRPKK